VEKQGPLAQIWRFVWPILVIAAAGALLTGLSFLFLKQEELSAQAYSTRVFWAGMILIVFGGFAAVASFGSLATTGTPSINTAGADSRVAQSRIQDHFRTNNKRYSFVLRMLVSGLICVGISALVDIASRP
jgi:hypothetical protein